VIGRGVGFEAAVAGDVELLIEVDDVLAQGVVEPLRLECGFGHDGRAEHALVVGDPAVRRLRLEPRHVPLEP